MTHTHTGHKPFTGWTRSTPGVRHALNGGPASFLALCGERVGLCNRDERGEPVPPNVCEVGGGGEVTCKRCLLMIARAEK